MTLIIFIVLGRYILQAPAGVKFLVLAEKGIYKFKNILYTLF